MQGKFLLGTYSGTSLNNGILVKVIKVSLMKLISVETKTLNAKYLYNKLTNKNLLWFIDAISIIINEGIIKF